MDRHDAAGPRASDHAIGGSSSGAIAAFGVAWFRPDVFSKVLSNVGSFVNMRGENRNDALDGFIVAASLRHLAEHDSVAVALSTPVRTNVLRYGLKVELRRHEPPEPFMPPTPSVFISDAL